MIITLAARAALTACLISAASLATAQPMEGAWHHGGGMGGGMGGGEMEFLRGLSLTDAQKKQAHDIITAAWTQAKPLMEQMHALHEQQINLLLTANSTAAQITPVLKQEASVRNQLETRHLAVALQLRGLLTTQQLAQAADLHTKMEALHQQEHDMLETARGGAN